MRHEAGNRCKNDGGKGGAQGNMHDMLMGDTKAGKTEDQHRYNHQTAADPHQPGDSRYRAQGQIDEVQAQHDWDTSRAGLPMASIFPTAGSGCTLLFLQRPGPGAEKNEALPDPADHDAAFAHTQQKAW